MIMKTKTKTRTQFKENAYYYFWGAATIAVVVGQIYIGNGYRDMSKSIDSLNKTLINRPRTMPADKPLYEMPIVK